MARLQLALQKQDGGALEVQTLITKLEYFSNYKAWPQETKGWEEQERRAEEVVTEMGAVEGAQARGWVSGYPGPCFISRLIPPTEREH